MDADEGIQIYNVDKFLEKEVINIKKVDEQQLKKGGPKDEISDQINIFRWRRNYS